MKIEQLKRKFCCWKNCLLDASQCADKKWIDTRRRALHCTRDSEPGIEMSARSAASEEYAYYARWNENEGSVAREPITFSCALPMFTRMPVMSSDSTRFDLPYEMNGRVRPV